MAVNNIAMKAYTNALQSAHTQRQQQRSGEVLAGKHTKQPDKSFGQTINESLKNVNSLQSEKKEMIESFASGEEQNVHELMISLQKAGLAMSMTSAVRGKVMESYKQLMQMPF